MSVDPVRDAFSRLQELVQSAESPDTKALLEAIQIHAVITNTRLTAIEHLIASATAKASKSLVGL